jgi:propionyl-CoA synthetase
MRSIADGEPWTMPATIEDAESLDEVTLALRSLGYAKKTKDGSEGNNLVSSG